MVRSPVAKTGEEDRLSDDADFIPPSSSLGRACDTESVPRTAPRRSSARARGRERSWAMLRRKYRTSAVDHPSLSAPRAPADRGDKEAVGSHESGLDQIADPITGRAHRPHSADHRIQGLIVVARSGPLPEPDPPPSSLAATTHPMPSSPSSKPSDYDADVTSANPFHDKGRRGHIGIIRRSA
jgi:hypothetical protein